MSLEKYVILSLLLSIQKECLEESSYSTLAKTDPIFSPRVFLPELSLPYAIHFPYFSLKGPRKEGDFSLLDV